MVWFIARTVSLKELGLTHRGVQASVFVHLAILRFAILVPRGRWGNPVGDRLSDERLNRAIA